MGTYQCPALVGLLLALLILVGACQEAPSTPQASGPPPVPAPAQKPPATTPRDTAPEASPSPPATAPQTTAPITPTSPEKPPQAEPTVIAEDFWQTFPSHFGFMPAHWDFTAAREAGGAYDRPFFELFQWDMIEKAPGHFDFYETDKHVKNAQAHGLHILANIQPFAVWDQAKCHGPQPAGKPGPGPQSTKGKPCDMEGYRNFVSRLVERYDGDGRDDMPGLTVPIKHWELMNEPEFQTNPIYFQGTPAEYAEVLEVTYEAVKQADPEAYIVQGGMAGMMDESAAWWQGVFDAGGAKYLDIMNMHSIGHGEHLNIPAFQQLLARNGLQDKPVWVTEVQFQQARQTQSYTNEDFARILARSYIFALANGADKLFYVNLRMPPFYDPGIPFDERSALITNSGEKSALFQAHLTVASMLGELGESDAVEIIREMVGDWHIDEGQYKFIIQGRTIYALWGSGPLPSTITGEVRIIDITRAESMADAATLRLSDSPIFVLPE